MNTKAIFCTTFIIAIGVCFVIPGIAISYGLANTHDGNDTTTKIQEHDSNTTAIKAPSHKDYAYRLQVKVEGMDQQEVNVSSSPNTASGISVAKAISIQKPFMFIYMVTIAPKLIHSTHAYSDSMVLKCVKIQ